MQRVQARATHPDERITAARVDGDAPGGIELGARAGAVEEATGAAAGEGGGRPGGDVDTADTVVISVLRCIMKGHAEEELNRRFGRAVWYGNPCAAPTPCARRVCRLRDGVMRVVQGGTHPDEREGAAFDVVRMHVRIALINYTSQSSRQSAIHQDVHTSVTKFRAECHPPGCSYLSHNVLGREPSTRMFIPHKVR